jgi:hypothetical protein
MGQGGHGAGQAVSCKNEQQKLANCGIPDWINSAQIKA